MITKKYTLLFLLAAAIFMLSCSPTRYREPKKPRNHYRAKGKNTWMDEKRKNIQKF